MPQDSGWSWCICFGSFVACFVAGGLSNCGGVVLSALVDRFHTTRTEAAWVSTLVSSGLYFFSPISTFCCKRYGERITVVIGTMVLCASLIISSFVTSIKLLYITYGIPMGLGCCLCYYAPFLMISKYFKLKLATANGIAYSGGALGTLVLSPLIQQLFARIGMRNGFRVMAGFCLLLFIPIIIYRPLEGRSTNDEMKSTKKWVNTKVFRNRYYLVWMVALFLFLMNYNTPYIHLVRLGEDVGASKFTASLLVSFLAISSFIGRLLSGRLADLPCSNRLVMCQLSLLSIAVSTTLAGFAPSYGWVALYACVFGVNEGVYVMGVFVITQDIVGKDDVAFGIGVLYLVLSIPRTIGPVLAGLMFDATQKYTLPFMIMGGLTVVSCVILFCIPYKRLTTHRKAKECEEVKLQETTV